MNKDITIWHGLRWPYSG